MISKDFEIGRIIAIDTAEVSIELNSDIKGMSRSTYEGPQEVGRINSYIIIPVGARRLVGMVTRVVLVEEAEVRADRTMVTLPTSRRLMKATIIGTIDKNIFSQGISVFPVLDTPVVLASQQDLDAIFGPIILPSDPGVIPEKPGFCIRIGDSPVMEGRPIRIDPDAFFGKHAAVIGSTGSGKSCTIASLIQAIHEDQRIKRTTFIILDTNGEYREAFQRYNQDSQSWENIPHIECLYIPSDPLKRNDRLVIPYWFMNSDDFIRLFQASKGVQRPVLLEALRMARNDAASTSSLSNFREELIWEFNRIWSLSGRDEKTSKDIKILAEGLKRRLKKEDLKELWGEIGQEYNITMNELESAIEKIKLIASNLVDNGKYPNYVPSDAKADIREVIDPLFRKLTGLAIGEKNNNSGRSPDAPSYFDKAKFRNRHLEQVLRREESGGPRARDYTGTMLLRIDRLLSDKRFDFLFGSTNEMMPNPEHVLAAFIRDILGIGSCESVSLTDETLAPKTKLPFYDRQRNKESPSDLVILDLSLLAAEVLENVTALLGRLILEFLQRLGEQNGQYKRGSLPVVLVLEEAQNYIQQPKSLEEESISRAIFERIAREGRKYGLSLIVCSQRPSELSRTVLSQCSSFIVHRLQNPEDLRYFKEIVPGIYGPLLGQLSSLAPQLALILGECVPAPTLVRVREANPTPKSHNPKFYKYWTQKEAPKINVEDICDKWEEKDRSIEAQCKNHNKEDPL